MDAELKNALDKLATAKDLANLEDKVDGIAGSINELFDLKKLQGEVSRMRDVIRELHPTADL